MGRRAEAREAKRAAKHQKHLDKKARQAENPNTSKRVAEQVPVLPAKEVREAPPPITQVRMTWSDDRADRVGEWSWGARNFDDELWEREVRMMLRHHEGKTWGAIENEKCNGKRGKREKKNKPYHVKQLREEVQERWRELGLEEFPEVFRFRTSSLKRIFGIRITHEFHVLWYDPEHMIYPLKKKNSK